MFRNLSNPLLVGVLWVLFPNVASAWSSPASKTFQRLHALEMMVDEYRSDHGRLPSQENFRLALESEASAITREQDLFHDSWHREIVYRIPGVHGEFDLQSTGEDGIDDQGGKDDISNWGGVNDGYYWMRWWPLGRLVLVAACGLAMILVLSKVIHPWDSAGPLAGMTLGAGTSTGCFLLLHPGVVPSRNLPLSIAIAVGALVLLISLLSLRGAPRDSKANR